VVAGASFSFTMNTRARAGMVLLRFLDTWWMSPGDS